MEQRASIPVLPPITNPLPSYWQVPRSPLANVIEPETDKPTEPYDYAIIGSGISGTMIAHNLLQMRPDARVVMLESREICSGATGRNGGHTKAASYRTYLQHVKELGKQEALKIARLEYANIIETHRLAETMGLDCENKLCNTVDLIYDRSTFESGKMAIQALRAATEDHEKEVGKAAWYQIHEDIAEVQKQFFVASENANPTIKGLEKLEGAFEYVAGRVHAYRFTTGVLSECVRKGLQLCTNTTVDSIQPSQETSKGSIARWDIISKHNTISAGHVIVAANGYTPYVLKELQGAIVPMRGQITVQRPGSATKLPAPLPTTYSFIGRNGYEYMIPRPLSDGGQHIVIGGGLARLPDAGASEFGTVDDGSLNPTISEYLRETLTGYHGAEVWGETSDTEAKNRVEQEWTGIMGATADGQPFVGEVPGKNGLWISAGFNGHGMVLCLKSAEALVSMIEAGGVHGRPEWFPDSFLISKERLDKCHFRGRTDIMVEK
jgi:glycine/D-amino acid oxidase-like deaminating enzyme